MEKPYKLINQSEVSILTSTLSSICSEWTNDWLIEPNQLICEEIIINEALERCTNLHGEKSGYRISNAGNEWIEIYPNAVFNNAIVIAMAGGDAISSTEDITSLTEELIKTALLGLSKRILRSDDIKEPDGSLVIAQAKPDAINWQKGVGTALAVLQLGDGEAYLLISPKVINRFCHDVALATQESRPLCTITQAIRRQTVGIQAWLGNAQLEIADLKVLSVGDIIRIDKKLNEPMELVNVDGQHLGVGYLGQSNGNKVIQLIVN